MKESEEGKQWKFIEGVLSNSGCPHHKHEVRRQSRTCMAEKFTNRKRTARIGDVHGGYAIKSETNREVDTVAKMCQQWRPKRQGEA